MLKNLIQLKDIRHLLGQSASLQIAIRKQNTRWLSKEDNSAQNAATQERNPFAKSITAPEFSIPATNMVQLTGSEREKKLKVIQLEVDIAHQEGRRVPELSFFQDYHWEHLLTLPSKTARIKYFAFLWQIQIKKLSKENKKIERQKALIIRKELEKKDAESNPHIIYGLTHTSFFLRIYDATMNHWNNNKLTRAMQFGSKMVLDCSYDQHMNVREAVNAAKQLMLSFAENRLDDDPFDLHYCNANFSGVCMQNLKRHIPTMLEPSFPMNIHEQCFTELFPRKNLVYLTPHCRTDLQEFNPDDIYIVGAIVDTVNNEPVSLAKAKKLGIRMARLPLDRYLQWGSGSGKSLTLNQMIKIMLELKNTGDWDRALQHVPQRKVFNIEKESSYNKQFLRKRADSLKIHVDRSFGEESENERARHRAPVKNRLENLTFNLETWGSKKRNSQ